MTTAKKDKPNDRKATAYIDFGQERRDKIRRFCARQEVADGKRPNLQDAVCQLVDIALESLRQTEVKELV